MRRLNTSGSAGQGFYLVGRKGDGTDEAVGPMGEEVRVCLTFSFGASACRLGVSIHFDYHWHTELDRRG